jgi:ATP-binding cassette subfamily B protein
MLASRAVRLQETVLFRASVWQNIAYGRPEATKEEILPAAQLTNADEFIGTNCSPPGFSSIPRAAGR